LNKHEITQFVAKAINLSETQAGKTINAFNLLHAIVSAKAKCCFSVAKSMKAKETQEPPEHPLELTKVSSRPLQLPVP
jgi:hypothetical protein